MKNKSHDQAWLILKVCLKSMWHVCHRISALSYEKQVHIWKCIQMTHWYFKNFLSLIFILKLFSFRVTLSWHSCTHNCPRMWLSWVAKLWCPDDCHNNWCDIFSADMQHDGSFGGDLLLGKVSHYQRSPGGRIHSCRVVLSLLKFKLQFKKKKLSMSFLGNTSWQAHQWCPKENQEWRH